MREIAVLVVAMAVLFVGLIALGNWLESSKCHARWAGVGKPSYGIIQGCLVTMPDGRTFPARMLRVLE